MKIVHIITRLIIGGAQENTLISCEGQHDLGHDVTLMTGPAIGPEGSLTERAQKYGYKVEIMDAMRRAIHPMRDYKIYRDIKNRLKELKPDIVHTHSSKAGIIGRHAAHAAKVPVIIHTIHGLAFTASTSKLVNGVYKMLERRAAPMSTRIVCVADAMRDQSLAASIGKPEQYRTVYSGMDTSPFLNPPTPRSEIRAQLGLNDRHVVIGTIARLFDLKGHEDLLAIAPELCMAYPNVRFLWVGDGLLRNKFEQQMLEMNLRDRFILTGMIPPTEVPKYAAAMDIMAHPSRREGLARALPQGSLAGIPTITYDIDGAKEGTIDQQSGFIIPPFKKDQLAAAIIKLVERPDLRKQMGEWGRDFALKRFDAKVMVSDLEKVYAEALREKRDGE